VGAYLDEYAASQISVIETAGGFALRSTLPGSGTVPTLLEFAHQDLAERNTLLARRRGRGAMAAAQLHRLRSDYLSLDAMYQDLLRALGWELDDSSAYNVLLEEVEGGFFVTYVAPNNQQDPVWTKRIARLGIPELESVLKDAHGRRQPPPLQRRRIAPVR
jgi:hypothetical protein